MPTYTNLPVHTAHLRTIIALDIEDSTSRPDVIKACLRRGLYDLLERALETGGPATGRCDPFIDRGDGVLVLLQAVAGAPEAVLLSHVIPRLRLMLTEHNLRTPSQKFRLRVVVHRGEVHYDRRGCFGESLDLAFRLLDAAPVKHALRLAPTFLVLVVSDEVHQSAVLPGMNAHTFTPLVHLRIAGRLQRGWVQAVGSRGVRSAPGHADGLLHRTNDL